MGRELEKLKAQGALVLDFGSKSFLDFGKNQNDVGTVTNCSFQGGGLKVGSGGYLVVPDSTSLRMVDQSWVFKLPVKKNTSYSTHLAGKRDAGGTQITISVADDWGFIQVYDGSASSVATVDLLPYETIGVSIESGSLPVLYLDGNKSTAIFDNAVTITPNDADLTLFNRYSLSRELDGVASFVVNTASILSATQHAKIYAELEELQYLRETAVIDRSLPYLKPAPDDTGLILSPGVVHGNQWLDDSEAGNDGTINGASVVHTAMGGCLANSGGGYVALGNAVDFSLDFLLCAWVYLQSVGANQWVIGKDEVGARSLVFGVNGSGKLDAQFSGSAQTDGTTTLTANEWHHLGIYFRSSDRRTMYLLDGAIDGDFVATVAPASTANNISLFRRDYTGFTDELLGSIVAPQIYTTLPDNLALFAKREYMRGLYACQTMGYGVQASVANVTGYVENTSLISDAAVKIIEETIDGDHVKILEAQAPANVNFSKQFDLPQYPYVYGHLDTGSGYVRTLLVLFGGVLSMASGDKLVLSSSRSKYGLVARAVGEV